MATTRDDEKDKKKKEAEANDSPSKEAPARDSRDWGDSRSFADALRGVDSRTPQEKTDAAQRAKDFQARVDRGEVSRDTSWNNSNTRERGGDKASPLLVPANQTEEARIARRELLTTGSAALKASADQAELDAEKDYKPGTAGQVGSLLGGALFGGLGAGAGKGLGNLIGRQMAGSAARKKTFDAANAEEVSTSRTLLERDSKDGVPNVTPGVPKAPVANEAEKVVAQPAAPTFDDFVAKARKRKGYLSTILAGNVSGAVPQGKALYGS